MASKLVRSFNCSLLIYSYEVFSTNFSIMNDIEEDGDTKMDELSVDSNIELPYIAVWKIPISFEI